jgi:hypothetical protein
MAIRDLWRKLTQRRTKDKEVDLRPEHDKLPGLDHFVQPPTPQGLEKPKY